IVFQFFCLFFLLLLCFFCFFFSSRRRHTRSKRDWSSDVCSSDLSRHLRGAGLAGAPAGPGGGKHRCLRRAPRREAAAVRPRDMRSEERRVGKGVGLGGWRMIKKEREERREGCDKGYVKSTSRCSG